jgi:hypothetical protein
MKSLLTNALTVLFSGLKGLQWKPALMALILALFGQASSQEFRIIPVTLHSLLTADYSADPINLQFPVLNLSIILEALGDNAPGRASIANATLQSSLLTPVASVTPLPGEIIQKPPTASPTMTLITPSITASATPTPSPTPNLNPIETETPTNQPFFTPQPTTWATLAPTKTKTTQNRPTSTQAFRPSPTPTQAPPTLAPTPTNKPPTATTRPTATRPPNPYPAPTKPPYP